MKPRPDSYQDQESVARQVTVCMRKPTIIILQSRHSIDPTSNDLPSLDSVSVNPHREAFFVVVVCSR